MIAYTWIQTLVVAHTMSVVPNFILNKIFSPTRKDFVVYFHCEPVLFLLFSFFFEGDLLKADGFLYFLLRNKKVHALHMDKVNTSMKAKVKASTVMKKRPKRRPRYGAISDSTCNENSVSARSKPAKNAPNAMDRPA